MIGWFVTSYKFILNALPIISVRLREARERREEEKALKKGAGLPFVRGPNDIDTDPSALNHRNRHYSEPGSPTSSYPNSDHEHGLSMGSLARGKSSMKRMSFTPLDLSSGTSSRAVTPPLHTDKHARFSEPDEEYFTRQENQTNRQNNDNVPVTPGHLSTSVQTAVIIAQKKGYVYQRWHAAVAGAVSGGVAVLLEKKDRRLGISQQLFVR